MLFRLFFFYLITFTIYDTCFLFSRQMSDKSSYLISVTVNLEKKILYKGFHYQYCTNQESAILYEDFDHNSTSLKVLKLTKEELSRGKEIYIFLLLFV